MNNPITTLKQCHENYLKFKDSLFDTTDETAYDFMKDIVFWTALKAKLPCEDLSPREQTIYKTIEAQSYAKGIIAGNGMGTFSGISGTITTMIACKFIKNAFQMSRTPHLRNKKMYALISAQLGTSILFAKIIYEIGDIFNRMNLKNYSDFNKLMRDENNPLKDFGPKMPTAW